MRTGKVARIADRVRKELGELTPQERDLAVKALRDALYEGFALDVATSDRTRWRRACAAAASASSAKGVDVTAPNVGSA